MELNVKFEFICLITSLRVYFIIYSYVEHPEIECLRIHPSFTEFSNEKISINCFCFYFTFFLENINGHSLN